MQDCAHCLSATAPACSFPLKIDTGAATGTYTLTIQDKFGKRYIKTVTIASDHLITINASDIPDGLFTPFSGSFLLWLQNDDGSHDDSFDDSMDIESTIDVTDFVDDEGNSWPALQLSFFEDVEEVYSSGYTLEL